MRLPLWVSSTRHPFSLLTIQLQGVDYDTDAVIQKSIRKELSGVTLIIVAHRLATVMDADKIMVLDAGKMVEFGAPWELLQHSKGQLRALVDQSGDKDELIAMAKRGRPT